MEDGSKAAAARERTAAVVTEEAVDKPVPDVDMDFDGVDDDELLQGIDPSNQRPQGEEPEAELAVEQWRVVQRGTARKIAEQYGRLIAAKRPKTRQCG